MKKIVSILLTFVLVLQCMSFVFASSGSLDNFKTVNKYETGQFADVKSSDWFESSVATAYKLNLVKGASANTFNPSGNLSIAEALALACRLHNIYNGGSGIFEQGQPWYQVYVDYAIANKIITGSEYQDYTKYATRAEFASIFSNTLPDAALKQINEVAQGDIPDVHGNEAYANAVYKLYRGGILTGSGSKGTFYPNNSIQRSEVAAIVARMAIESERKSVSFDNKPAEVRLNFDEYYIKVGEVLPVIGVALPEDSNGRALKWNSSKESVVSVNEYGIVRAESVGDATITASTSNGKKASCIIHVSKQNPVEIISTSVTYNRTEADVTIKIKNNTTKEIKYVYMNAIGSDYYDSTIGSSKKLRCIGPIYGNSYGSFTFPALWNKGGISKVNLSSISVEYAVGGRDTVSSDNVTNEILLRAIEKAGDAVKFPESMNGVWYSYMADDSWNIKSSTICAKYTIDTSNRTVSWDHNPYSKNSAKLKGYNSVSSYFKTEENHSKGFSLFPIDNETILLEIADSGFVGSSNSAMHLVLKKGPLAQTSQSYKCDGYYEVYSYRAEDKLFQFPYWCFIVDTTKGFVYKCAGTSTDKSNTVVYKLKIYSIKDNCIICSSNNENDGGSSVYYLYVLGNDQIVLDESNTNEITQYGRFVGDPAMSNLLLLQRNETIKNESWMPIM